MEAEEVLIVCEDKNEVYIERGALPYWTEFLKILKGPVVAVSVQ